MTVEREEGPPEDRRAAALEHAGGELDKRATEPEAPARTGFRRIVLHLIAAVYVLPQFVYPGEPIVDGLLPVWYRMSAGYVVCGIAFYWNIRYLGWVFSRLYGLAPGVQARTGARVRIAHRRIEWDRSVGFGDWCLLLLQYLRFVVVVSLIWGVVIFALTAFMQLMYGGPEGFFEIFR